MVSMDPRSLGGQIMIEVRYHTIGRWTSERSFFGTGEWDLKILSRPLTIHHPTLTPPFIHPRRQELCIHNLPPKIQEHALIPSCLRSQTTVPPCTLSTSGRRLGGNIRSSPISRPSDAPVGAVDGHDSRSQPAVAKVSK